MKRGVVVILSLIFVHLTSFAQQDTGSDWEFGVQMGRVLPSQIDGVTEILDAWTMRTGYRLTNYNFEFGLTSATSEDASWNDLALSVRADVPFQDLFGHLYVGLNAIQYSGLNLAEQYTGGGHLGVGLSMKVARSLWFRSDMTFNFNPGVVMFIKFGLVFDFSSAGENQG